jgi:hypothetical protein
MLRRVFILLAFILLPSAAGATTWYFSDCATGDLGDGVLDATSGTTYG